ncbi:MAG: exodeoxyribonuclease VII large subunit [Candidatus Moraniibacteriota bacterium]|nr:MAG: exodeoxyribonuclease VII large subunit [Candidatus Moranbacteria bacterium]
MNDLPLLTALRSWRDEQARTEGLPGYRILPNATLEAIALALPKNRDDLCVLKGIKEAKFRRYGKQILNLVAPYLSDREQETSGKIQDTKNIPLQEVSHSQVASIEYPISDTLTVSQFLDGLNLELSGMAARIKGEVTSVDIRERVIYFSLKDSGDDSVLNCLMFRYQYDVAGIKLTVGDEIIVEGSPDIYKPSGRLSLRVGSLEYAGEGALKKAYDALFRKLEGAGIFAPENKRSLPRLPERIALITSQEGAAIGDFTMNLSRVGFQVHLYPTLVEGKRAVFDIIKAVEFFNRKPECYDVLVIIRGGGSLESLQAFNTESLVMAVRNSTIPVLAGIGHERDVSLVALAADKMVSTPTATAKELSLGWDEARERIDREELFLKTTMEKLARDLEYRIEDQEQLLREGLVTILERVENIRRRFQEKLLLFSGSFRSLQEKLEQYFPAWKLQFEGALGRTHQILDTTTEKVEQYNPVRVLRLGYSLVRSGGKLLHEAREVEVGEYINIELGSGRIEGEVKKVIDK